MRVRLKCVPEEILTLLVSIHALMRVRPAPAKKKKTELKFQSTHS